jgi:hypothetical protein
MGAMTMKALDEKQREEIAQRLERTLEASLEPLVDEILDAERTEPLNYERECQRAAELEQQLFTDLQKKLECLVDAVLERGGTCISIEIRETDEPSPVIEICSE